MEDFIIGGFCPSCGKRVGHDNNCPYSISSQSENVIKMIDEEESLTIEQRLNQCVKDEDGQPLICYGCSHSAAYCTYTDGTLVEGTDFPGMPSGERPCCFCIRNKNKCLEVDKWYDQSEPLKVPMDCYHSLDMLKQFEKWSEKENYNERS